MANYLLKKGHRKLLFLTDNDHAVDHERWLGVQAALEEEQVENVASSHILIAREPSGRKRQYQEMLPFLRKQSALFFASDLYAVEALNFLCETFQTCADHRAPERGRKGAACGAGGSQTDAGGTGGSGIQSINPAD